MSDTAEQSGSKHSASEPETAPLLLCYDGSDHAASAIRRAAILTRPRSAIVLHVPREVSHDDLAQSGRRLALDAGFKPVSVVEAEPARVADTILDEAHRRGVTAIVVGSRGRSAGAATILGSVSSTLVHHADVPVLVVRPAATPSEQSASEPVFICYDGSDIAGAAIATAGKLLAGHDAIVASFPDSVVYYDDALRSKLPWPPRPELEDQLARIELAEAEAPLEGAELARRAGFASRPYPILASRPYAGEEAAWHSLLAAAAKEAAACIVVGHRRTAKHLGSTAYGLVHHADRPVLVVPLAHLSVRFILDVRLKPGCRDELTRAYAALRQRVEQAPGLLSHHLCESIDDPERWLVISEWKTLEASTAWDRSDEHERFTAPMHACFAQASSSKFHVRDGARR